MQLAGEYWMIERIITRKILKNKLLQLNENFGKSSKLKKEIQAMKSEEFDVVT